MDIEKTIKELAVNNQYGNTDQLWDALEIIVEHLNKRSTAVKCEHTWERRDDYCQYCSKCDVMRHELENSTKQLDSKDKCEHKYIPTRTFPHGRCYKCAHVKDANELDSKDIELIKEEK